MAVAEISFEYAAAQSIHYVADQNRPGRSREGIPAILAARCLHEPALSEGTQKLRRVSRRHPFSMADFRNREAPAFARIAYADQATKAVLFVGSQFHLRNLAIGMM